jgi:hypothetical protein
VKDDDGMTLVMPFVTVASKGGPHDDEAFTAGWQMGGISCLLCMGQPQLYEVTIRTDCIPQADLIAMDRGYVLKTAESELEGWSFASFTRMATLGGER